MDTITDQIIEDIDDWAVDDTEAAGRLFKTFVVDMIDEADLLDQYSLLLDLLDISQVNWEELGQAALETAFE